jgi:hypothetical protein
VMRGDPGEIAKAESLMVTASPFILLPSQSSNCMRE